MAERAQRAGIETRAWVSASVLDPAFGLGQGFDRYESPESPEVRRDMEFESLRAHDVVHEVVGWLEQRDASRPFLAWVHLWDPHRPWRAEPRFRQKGPYLSEVASVDDAAGILIEVLRARGQLEQTTVLVVGDHGEGLGEHGERSHSLLTYQSTLPVPLILRPPGGVPGGRRERGVVSVVDVAPTLIEALGLPALPGIDGSSLLAERPESGRGAYFESYYGTLSYGWHQLAGWVDDGGKYVFCSEPVLFDLETDPGELAGRPADATPDGARYRTAIEQLCSLPALPAGRAGLAEEQLEAIRSLGYVTSSGTDVPLPAPLEPSERLDPMHNIQVVQDLSEAMGSFGTGEVERAEELLTRVLGADPGNAYALALLGTARMMLGRHADAVEPLLRAVNHGQDSAINLGNLAVCYLALGQEREALGWFEQAYERNPRSTIVLKNLAGLHRLAGRDDLAERFGREYEALTGERP